MNNKQSNYDATVEVIGQAIFDYFPDRDEKGKCADEDDRKACEAVDTFLSCADEGYVLVQWPDSQEYMEEDWFDEEAILALGSEDKTGSSAYFIPIKRVI